MSTITMKVNNTRRPFAAAQPVAPNPETTPVSRMLGVVFDLQPELQVAVTAVHQPGTRLAPDSVSDTPAVDATAQPSSHYRHWGINE